MNAPKLRVICASVLCAIFVVGLFAGTVSPYPYAKQFRERPNAAPSSTHLLGTDSLGRDLFARLIYGTRVSLLLAPAAALLATLLAGIFGGVAGLLGGWCEKFILAATDLPWLFRCCLSCWLCAPSYRWIFHPSFPSSLLLLC